MGSVMTEISFSEYLICNELTFEWADSYDTKDWDRLESILAPTLKIQYSSINELKDDKLPASDFVKMMSAPDFLGDPLVHTQHLMGASKYRKIAPDLIQGYHQIRAAHQRYTSPDLQEVEAKGHAHGVIMLVYRKVNDQWKWGGITTDVRWNEFDFHKMFKFMERNTPHF